MLRQLNLLFMGFRIESYLEYLDCLWLLKFCPKGILNNLKTKTDLHKLLQNSLQEVLLMSFDVNLRSINEKKMPNESSKGMSLISFLLISRYGFPSKQYKKQAHKIIEEGKTKQWIWAL